MASNTDWLEIETEVRLGNKPLSQIAREFAVSASTLRRRIREQGWEKDALAAKRARVNTHYAGLTTPLHYQDYAVGEAIDHAVNEDILDMDKGLVNARLGLDATYKALQFVHFAMSDSEGLQKNLRHLKLLAEANERFVTTIRRIRGLDEPAAVQSLSLCEEDKAILAQYQASFNDG